MFHYNHLLKIFSILETLIAINYVFEAAEVLMTLGSALSERKTRQLHTVFYLTRIRNETLAVRCCSIK